MKSIQTQIIRMFGLSGRTAAWCRSELNAQEFGFNDQGQPQMVEKVTRSILNRVEIRADNPKERTLRLTGPDALAVAIHDAIVEGGLRHREVDFTTFAKHSRAHINPEYARMNRTHYMLLNLNESIYLRRRTTIM
jgi:hypothetical protein